MSKTLVAYFSYSGTTQHLAKTIANIKNADLFQIETIKKYPQGYSEVLKESEEEKRSNARPKLKDIDINMDDYDTIILGYPNWYGTCPMPVFTFLEKFDLSGKTIAPFCTHGGSRMGNSEVDIKKSAPHSKVLKGYAGGISNKKELENWLKAF